MKSLSSLPPGLWIKYYSQQPVAIKKILDKITKQPKLITNV